MLKKIWFFITNNWSFSTWLLIPIVIILLLFYRHNLIQSGIEEGKGEQHIQKGQIVTDLSQFAIAREKGLTEITELVDPKTNESIWVVSGTTISQPTAYNRFGVLVLSDASNIGFGVTYSMTEVGRFNVDAILSTSGWGAGVSYDLTKDTFIEASIIEPYQLESIQSLNEEKQFNIGYGWRF